MDPAHKASKFPTAHNRYCTVQGLHPLSRTSSSGNLETSIPIGLEVSLPMGGGWNLVICKIPSIPTHSTFLSFLQLLDGQSDQTWHFGGNWSQLPCPFPRPGQVQVLSVFFSPFRESTHSSTALYIHAYSPDRVMELCNLGPGVLRSLAIHKTVVSGLMLFPSPQAVTELLI